MNFDVESVQSLNIIGTSNGDLLQTASQTKRILVTFDKDFLSYANRPHMGILLISIHPARDMFVLPEVEKFFEEVEIQQLNWVGKMVILKEDIYEILK